MFKMIKVWEVRYTSKDYGRRTNYFTNVYDAFRWTLAIYESEKKWHPSVEDEDMKYRIRERVLFSDKRFTINNYHPYIKWD